MTATLATLVEAWTALLAIPKADLIARLGFPERAVRENTRYIRLTGVARVYDDAIHPGQFYFRDGRLALLYIEQPADTYPPVTPQALAELLGRPADQLASRAGRDHQQYVYPDRGVAFSSNRDHVSFIEIFPPTTLDTYRAELYMAPGKFTR